MSGQRDRRAGTEHTSDPTGPCPCRRCPRLRAAGTDLEQLLTAQGFAGSVLDGPVDTVLTALPLLDQVVGVTAAGPVITNDVGTHLAPVGVGGPLRTPSTGISLRVDPVRLGSVVSTEPIGRTPPTLRFFDRDGAAVHAVYLTEHSDRLVFESLALIGPGAGGIGPAGLDGVPLGEGAASCVDVPRDQIAMFDHILSDGGRSRGKALAAGGAVARLESRQVIAALSHAALMTMPVTTVTTAPGCLQMRHDLLDGVREHSGTMVLASAGARTMIDFDDVAACWLTRADGVLGPTHAVELYDRHDRCCFVATVTGAVSESTWQGWEHLMADVGEYD
ncbi:MAG: ChuX/HutX family heme-like substrate-binding protein [Gordonia sp. (in: high G+C Gram-positive bacteria)]